VVIRLLGGIPCPKKYGLKGTIPAVVKSNVGSSAGTKDALGKCKWPFLTKYCVNFSLICWLILISTTPHEKFLEIIIKSPAVPWCRSPCAPFHNFEAYPAWLCSSLRAAIPSQEISLLKQGVEPGPQHTPRTQQGFLY